MIKKIIRPVTFTLAIALTILLFNLGELWGGFFCLSITASLLFGKFAGHQNEEGE